MYEGFIIAFFVGLAVNQITDLIGIGKGTVTNEVFNKTLILSIILSIICTAIGLVSYYNAIARFINNKEE
ncbi:hypothetical protein SDC9_199868 [bioreactor metagenome]|uniref:Uncharacterized protein n=1 Tax=bioreactor metagenome TaxID=1076179 RepID=A0A645IMY8_9ZZZZ